MDKNNNPDTIVSTFILTLLSPFASTQTLPSVTKILDENGFAVQKTTSLAREGGSVQQLGITGSQAIDIQKLRQAFFQLSEQIQIDICMQENARKHNNFRLIVFDMDSTLIQAEVIDLLAEAAGVGPQVASITERAMQGELDFNQSFRQRLAMLKGLDEKVLEGIAEAIPLMEGAERLIQVLKKLGYRTAIVSGGFRYFASHLQKKLGIDYIFANELEIIDGKVTGNVFGEIINGERKAALLKQIAAQEKLQPEQVIAVGDGANDLPMLGEAGLGIAFRAKPLVRRSVRVAISHMGLDGILYLLGLSEQELKTL